MVITGLESGGGVDETVGGDGEEWGVEDWFVAEVHEYITTHTEYTFHNAFVFLHERHFTEQRPMEFHNMRGKATLMLAQATGDYTPLTQWCENGSVRDTSDPRCRAEARPRYRTHSRV